LVGNNYTHVLCQNIVLYAFKSYLLFNDFHSLLIYLNARKIFFDLSDYLIQNRPLFSQLFANYDKRIDKSSLLSYDI